MKKEKTEAKYVLVRITSGFTGRNGIPYSADVRVVVPAAKATLWQESGVCEIIEERDPPDLSMYKSSMLTVKAIRVFMDSRTSQYVHIGDTFDVSKADAELLLLNEQVEIIGEAPLPEKETSHRPAEAKPKDKKTIESEKLQALRLQMQERLDKLKQQIRELQQDHIKLIEKSDISDDDRDARRESRERIRSARDDLSDIDIAIRCLIRRMSKLSGSTDTSRLDLITIR